MSLDRPTVVSTFSGCGGSSYGYKLAGCKVCAAVEYDNNAVACYRLNFPTTPLYYGDIRKLSTKALGALAGVAPGGLDILDGSPPCQGFSVAKGKRLAGDVRNSLFIDYVRLLRGLRPKAFVFENVRGMAMGKMKPIFARVLAELEASGYRIHAQVYNMMYFGVPQRRQRVILIGYRNDLGRAPTSMPRKTTPRSAGGALVGVPNTNGLHPLPGPLTGYFKTFYPLIPPGQNQGFLHQRMTQTYFGWGSLVKLHPYKPAPTIRKLVRSGGFASIVHWKAPRVLTIQEVKRLMSFPDDYKLAGNFTDQWARLGNSVPPRFMQYLAMHIRQELSL